MKLNYTRPAIINQYEKQRAFIDDPARYTLVEASTKAGKTVGCIVWLFEQALRGKPGQNYWWVAPVYAQAKIAFTRMLRYINPKAIRVPNYTEQSINLANGTKIWFKTGENPDNLFGEDVFACVIDEATRMKEDSWFAIRSTLTFTRGPVKIIGNVKGIGNWVYKLAREAEKGKENWSYHKLTAHDAVEAGVLDEAEIRDAEATLPKGVFLELYHAIPFVNSANKYCFAFDPERHVARTRLNEDLPIYLSFDFNKNPICCTIFQHYSGAIYAIEVLKLENSNIYNLCATIRNKYGHCLMIVTGDATGHASTALVRDNMNYYKVIRAELKLGSAQMKQPTSNPSVAENQVLVNAILEHYPIFIDPDKCAPLIFDMNFVEMMADGSIRKGDRDDPTQQADVLDTFRYYLNTNFKWFVKLKYQAA